MTFQSDEANQTTGRLGQDLPALTSQEADTRGALSRRLGRDSATAIALFVLTALLIVASRWISPALGGWSSAKAILVLSFFVMVVAFGQQLVMLIGGFDLSIASIMTIGGVLTFGWAGRSASTLLWVVPVVLIVGASIGALSGVGIAFLRVPPFIMTLATGIIVYGASLGITGGTPGGVPVPTLSALFSRHAFGVPYVIYLMVIVAALATLFQIRTPFGRRLYALGSSPQAAYIAGLSVRRLTITTYAISAAASAFAGILMVGYAGGATLTMGDSYLLPSIAAAVVGGTSILGGRGSYPGVAGGAVLLTALSTIISSLGLAQGWRTVIYGAVILVALLLLREELYVWTGRLSASLQRQTTIGVGSHSSEFKKTVPPPTEISCMRRPK